MTTRILGIDPSLRSSGFGMIEVDRGEIVSWASWTFSPPSKAQAPIQDRITAIFKQVTQAIVNREIDIIAIESGFVRGSHGTSLVLGYVRAACMIAARSFEKPFFEYTPQQAKRAATSYGGASKDQVMDTMTAILNSDARLPNDEADALAVAFCHWNHMDEAAIIGAALTAGRPE